MKKKIKVSSVSHRKGLLKDLRDPVFAIAYLNACLTQYGVAAFRKAVRNVAEASVLSQ